LNRVLHFCLSWPGPWSSYLHFLSSWDDRHEPPYPAIGWDEISLTFCLGWPQIVILLISACR
jgi:hypothetical protein